MTTLRSITEQPGNLGAVTVFFDLCEENPNDDISTNAFFTYLKNYKKPPATPVTQVASYLHEKLESSDAETTTKELAAFASFFFNTLHRQEEAPPRTLEDLGNLVQEYRDSDYLTAYVMRSLIELPFKPTYPLTHPLQGCSDENFVRPLISPKFSIYDDFNTSTYVLMQKAAELDDPFLVRALRSRGVALNYPNPRRACSPGHLPAIFRAAFTDSLDVIHLMNNLGVNVDEPYRVLELEDDKPSYELMTPLSYAVERKRLKAARELLRLGASPCAKFVQDGAKILRSAHPLFKAINSQHKGLLQLIFEAIPSPLTELDQRGWNLGQAAAQVGNVVIIDLLKHWGVDFNSHTTSNRSTPLLLATEKQHHGAVEYIAENFPESLEVRDSLGRTPVIVATLNRDLDTLRILAQKNANLAAPWTDKKRPVDLFNHDEDPQLSNFFRKKGQKLKSSNAH